MRPTGRLHLGHYVGVLKNWVQLQDQYDCFFMIADWHALTTKYDETEMLNQNILEVALDWLACGIDPSNATLYVQSRIQEIAELHLLLSMITPNRWVETDPTLKDMVAMLHEDLTYGLLGYPILQTADILAMKADFVPVGKDQLAHLEISRDIVTRFNHQYKTPLFPSPKPLLTETPMLPGVDARKMGKSYGNAIYLADTEDETWNKLKQGITDPARIKRTDLGTPENCEVIFKYYEVFVTPEARQLADQECRSATRGCMDCKKILAEFVNAELRPIRERRAEYARDPAHVYALLAQGEAQARATAQQVLQEVRSAMKLFTGTVPSMSSP
jgi:tryptophanyl-tRNA synthetase